MLDTNRDEAQDWVGEGTEGSGWGASKSGGWGDGENEGGMYGDCGGGAKAGEADTTVAEVLPTATEPVDRGRGGELDLSAVDTCRTLSLAGMNTCEATGPAMPVMQAARATHRTAQQVENRSLGLSCAGELVGGHDAI
mmetsp:Transcript_763/g.1760  ORF Transcript_763/g.1760 Transcript_763/m.1760 type:complete len:138 (+) Transcript_763:972-1385(+)